MIAVWMLYALCVTMVLALVGVSLERIADAGRWPRRIGWAAVTVVALVLSAAVARRRDPALQRPSPVNFRTVDGALDGRLATSNTGVAVESRSTISDHLRALPAMLASRLARWDAVLLVIWSAGAAGLATAYLLAAWALSRRRRRWLSREVDGVPVLLAGDDGPAVVGVVNPRIVLPRWMLALDPSSRALLLRHECEHVLRHDPLLIHAATTAVVLMPWNPAMWWIHRRLRLAIELDCDARVLAASGDRVDDARHVARYGELLLTVAGRRSRHAFQVAPAFLEQTSSLSRRISAMCAQPLHRPRLQGALAGIAAATLLLVAARLPVPRLDAQQPGEPTVSRIIGSPSSSPAPVMSRTATRQLLQRYFPEVLRGEGPESVVFLRDGAGHIVGTIPMQTAERMIDFAREAATTTSGERMSRERDAREPRSNERSPERVDVMTGSGEARGYAVPRTEPQAAEQQEPRPLTREPAERDRAIRQRVERQQVERRSAEPRREELLRSRDDSNRLHENRMTVFYQRSPSAVELSADQRRMAERIISADFVRHDAGEVGPRPVRVLFLTICTGEQRR